ncbi:hypothetical protein NL676_012522 [Syzygium grande]|nr:hypothetical protein NL676_012522 [Syzygium grande]
MKGELVFGLLCPTHRSTSSTGTELAGLPGSSTCARFKARGLVAIDEQLFDGDEGELSAPGRDKLGANAGSVTATAAVAEVVVRQI